MNLRKKTPSLVTSVLFIMAFVISGCDNGTDPSPGIKVSEQTLTTSEDGTAAEFTVVLNTPPGSDVIIPVVSLDKGEVMVSPASLTFTNSEVSKWNEPQTVTVTGVDDFEIDGNQTVTVELQAAIADTSDYSDRDATDVQVQNSDNDTAGVTISEGTTIFPENGGSGSFSIVLNTIPLNDVVIDITSQDTTEATVSVAQITFDSTNWNIAQNIDLTGVADYIIDGNQTFDIAVAINASTVDTTGYAELVIPPVTITTSDGDTVGFTVSKSALNTSENGTSDTFTVVLNTIPDGDVIIDTRIADVTEANFSGEPGLWFDSSNWNIAQTVSVRGVNDSFADGSQESELTLTIHASTTDTTGYAVLTLPALTVTNADNDTAGFTVIGGPINSVENGSVKTFTVKPNTQPLPGANITVSIASSDTTEGSVSPASLSWSDVDWTTAKTITVTPLDDLVVDGNVVYNIELNPASSTETAYQSVAVQTVSVTNSDDDTAGFTVVSVPFTAEGGSPLPIMLKPNTRPSPGNVISLYGVSNDTTEGTITSRIVWSEADWTTTKAAYVTPVDDALADGSITYNIDLIPAVDSDAVYLALAPLTIAITNADDESTYVSSISPADGSVNQPLAGTIFSVTFTRSMLTSTISTNTADTTCSGSIQVSKDNFATCVQMNSSPVASAADKVFTLTPLADLEVGVYHMRVTTAATEALNGWTLDAEFNTINGVATIPAVGLPISVNNSNASTLTDFQVRVVLDSTFNWTDFSATGDEVRFYNGANELSYYVESYDQAAQTATYWVKADSLAANAATSLTVVPFTASLPAGSNGKNTFAFFDDFERIDLGPEWVIGGSGEGTISIDNGVLDLWGNLDGVYLSDRYISTITAT